MALLAGFLEPVCSTLGEIAYGPANFANKERNLPQGMPIEK